MLVARPPWSKTLAAVLTVRRIYVDREEEKTSRIWKEKVDGVARRISFGDRESAFSRGLDG